MVAMVKFLMAPFLGSVSASQTAVVLDSHGYVKVRDNCRSKTQNMLKKHTICSVFIPARAERCDGFFHNDEKRHVAVDILFSGLKICTLKTYTGIFPSSLFTGHIVNTLSEQYANSSCHTSLLDCHKASKLCVTGLLTVFQLPYITSFLTGAVLD